MTHPMCEQKGHWVQVRARKILPVNTQHETLTVTGPRRTGYESKVVRYNVL
jgi:hypothetical protein